MKLMKNFLVLVALAITLQSAKPGRYYFNVIHQYSEMSTWCVPASMSMIWGNTQSYWACKCQDIETWKVPLNVPAKAYKYMEMMNKRGYKTYEGNYDYILSRMVKCLEDYGPMFYEISTGNTHHNLPLTHMTVIHCVYVGLGSRDVVYYQDPELGPNKVDFDFWAHTYRVIGK